jgi:hypothetical protein
VSPRSVGVDFLDWSYTEPRRSRWQRTKSPLVKAGQRFQL